MRDWGGRSTGQVPAAQARGLEFHDPAPTLKPGMDDCSPNIGVWGQGQNQAGVIYRFV